MKRYEQPKRWSILYLTLMLLACTTQAQGHLGDTQEDLIEKIGVPISIMRTETPQFSGVNREIVTWAKGVFIFKAAFHPYGNCYKLIVHKSQNMPFSYQEAQVIRRTLLGNQKFRPYKGIYKNTYKNSIHELTTDGRFQSIFSSEGNGELCLYDCMPEMNQTHPAIAQKWQKLVLKSNFAGLSSPYANFPQQWWGFQPSVQTIKPDGSMMAKWNAKDGPDGYNVTAFFLKDNIGRSICHAMKLNPIKNGFHSVVPTHYAQTMTSWFITHQVIFHEIHQCRIKTKEGEKISTICISDNGRYMQQFIHANDTDTSRVSCIYLYDLALETKLRSTKNISQ